MPKRALKPCKKIGCNKLTRDKTGYCEEHKVLAEQNKKERNKYYDEHVRNKRDKKYRDFYHSKEWERVRQRALVRDKGLCQHCIKENKITMADMVHHIIPIKDDWSKRLDLDNLVSLCHTCHNKILH